VWCVRPFETKPFLVVSPQDDIDKPTRREEHCSEDGVAMRSLPSVTEFPVADDAERKNFDEVCYEDIVSVV